MKNNNIRNIRILYLLVGGVLILCLGLFFGDVMQMHDRPRVAQFPDTDPTYAFRITDLVANDGIYLAERPVKDATDGVTAHTHIARYDVDIFTSDDRIGRDPRIVWVMVLQGFGILSAAAILVLTTIVLVSFYRSAKRDMVFPARNIVLLTVVGILLMATSLALDTSAYLERRVALDLLQGTAWQPNVHFTIHFTRIFFGLTLVFMTQVFRIGRQLQEDQELTI